MNERIEVVSCLLCGAADSELVAVKPPYAIVRCRACGLCYASPRPTPVAMAKFYERYFTERPETGHEHYRAGGKWREKVARKRLALLTRYVPRGRVLDHGCATGIFLREAARAGWEAWGVEMSAAAREVIAREAPDVKTLVPDDLYTLAPRTFDAVTMFDNFCYLPDPLSALRRFRSLLRPGGVVFSIGALDHRWAHSAPEPGITHTYYYSPKSVAKLCQASGFRLIVNTTVVKNANLPAGHPLAWLFQHVPGVRNLFFQQHFFIAIRDAAAT